MWLQCPGRELGFWLGWGTGAGSVRVWRGRGFQLCSWVHVGVMHEGRQEGSVGSWTDESGALGEGRAKGVTVGVIFG